MVCIVMFIVMEGVIYVRLCVFGVLGVVVVCGGYSG